MQHLGLVERVPVNLAQLFRSMGKLAFVTCKVLHMIRLSSVLCALYELAGEKLSAPDQHGDNE